VQERERTVGTTQPEDVDHAPLEPQVMELGEPERPDAHVDVRVEPKVEEPEAKT